MYRASKILERMVNQNNFNDISVGEKKKHHQFLSLIFCVIDFRFYEDQSDTYKELEGTLLPLWTFSYKDKEAKYRHENTALCWNARYHDLFAAGYGSCESLNFAKFTRSSIKCPLLPFSDDIYRQDDRGLVCVFSLKNPAHPEYVCEAASGVMCLDFHPKHPHMLVAGLYDGNVAVYNLQSSLIRPLNIAPMYESDAAGGKHMETCWQVRWIDDDLDNYLNFFSGENNSFALL